AHNSFTLLATTTLSVVAPTATLSVLPTSVAPGDGITATWGGIASPTSTDWIALFPAGAAIGRASCRDSTRGTASGRVPLSGPGSAALGRYELRLFAHNSFTLLATTTLSVVAPTATLSVLPTSVAPGDGITATWGGIASPTSTDWIALFPAGA